MLIYLYINPPWHQPGLEDCTHPLSFLSDSFRGLDALAAELHNFTQELEKKTFLPVSSEAWWSWWKGWWRYWSCDVFVSNTMIWKKMQSLHVVLSSVWTLLTWTNAELRVFLFSFEVIKVCDFLEHVLFIYNTQVCFKFILGYSWTQKKPVKNEAFKHPIYGL